MMAASSTNSFVREIQTSFGLHHPIPTPHGALDDSDVTDNNKLLGKDDGVTDSTADELKNTSAVVPAAHDAQLEFNGQPLFVKPNATNKRTRSNLSGSTQNTEDSDASNEKIKRAEAKKKKKKGQTLTADIISEQIKEANINIPSTTSATFPITNEQLISLVTETLPSKHMDSSQIAMRYTTNLNGVIIMINTVHAQVHCTSLYMVHHYTGRNVAKP